MLGVIVVKIAGVVKNSIVDGPGFRYVIFVQGCNHHCKGCHNPQTWNYNCGDDVSVSELIDDIRETFSSNPMMRGLTLSGGEPLDKSDDLLELVLGVKDIVKHIMIYSGYTLEEALVKGKETPSIIKLLSNCDWMVDGEFEIEKRDLEQMYKGSSNQRVINLNKFFETGDIVEIKFS